MIPKRIVKLVLERDRHRCLLRLARCMGEATVADHRADRGMGGSKTLNHPSALVAACGICNGDKTAAFGQVLADLIGRGVRVPKAATNAQTLRVCQLTPVVYPDGEFWLTSDGRRVRADVPFPG